MINKSEILTHLNALVDEKIHSIQLRYDDLNNDLSSDHKSSAGDKHETGRAMTQLEQEKLAGQLNQLEQQKETLSKIEINSPSKIQFGSLIKTSSGTFFMSIGLGKVEIKNAPVFCVSTSSPAGQKLMDLTSGDSYEFNGIKNTILDVI
ncbi:MAG: hypothetical protein QNL61_08510 [Crocinitomicaceae bacterium]|jgi:transcription elongation GreA/GreB family factor